jgi:hypothetical protein
VADEPSSWRVHGHQSHCASKYGRRCNCQPSYQAKVRMGRDGQTRTATFATLAAARAWKTDTEHAKRRGLVREPSAITIRLAGDDLIADMHAATARTRSGAPYRLRVIQNYAAALE